MHFLWFPIGLGWYALPSEYIRSGVREQISNTLNSVFIQFMRGTRTRSTISTDTELRLCGTHRLDSEQHTVLVRRLNTTRCLRYYWDCKQNGLFNIQNIQCKQIEYSTVQGIRRVDTLQKCGYYHRTITHSIQFCIQNIHTNTLARTHTYA